MVNIVFAFIFDVISTGVKKYIEELTAFTVSITFLNIDWTDKAANALLSVSVAMVSAFFANFMKQAKISEWIIKKFKNKFKKK